MSGITVSTYQDLTPKPVATNVADAVAENKEVSKANATTVANMAEGKQGEIETQAGKEVNSEEPQENAEADTESASENSEDSQEQDQQKGDKKKKGGFQRKIDKLNAQKAQAEQEKDYWKNLALKNAGIQHNDPNAPFKFPELNPVSNDKPDPDKFGTHAEYIEALADWKVEQKLKKQEETRQEKAKQEATNKMVEDFRSKVKTFSVTHPDFSEVMEEANDIVVSPDLQSLFLESENGPELAYKLAKNLPEFERISKLPPLAMAKAIGKFESENISKKETSLDKKITNAATPINPVKATGTKTVKNIYDPNLSQSDYEKMRWEQIKKKNASY